MEIFDKNYLKVQFQLNVHKKNATVFQTFFEDIMQEAFSGGFQKIRPYGNEGDRGNDGYRPAEGIYYQVYAPRDPTEKEAEAARKLKIDFNTLKGAWNQISVIKRFCFVFNDKYQGVSIELERVLSQLRNENPKIEFELFLPKHLEEIFFSLKKESMISLGFDVDSANAFRVCNETLKSLEIYLDRGNGRFVLESLQNWKDIISRQNNEDLLLEWELMECRALRLLEKVDKAKEQYESLCRRHPRDPRPFLRLAEIYLDIEDYEKNAELLEKAERIDEGYWLLELEKLLRSERLRIKLDAEGIDEQNFPADPKIRANYYRMYAIFFLEAGDFARAESYVEKAVYLNPDRFSNYIAKLSILDYRFLSS